MTLDLSDDTRLGSSNVVIHEVDNSQHVSQQMHSVVGRVSLLSVNIRSLLKNYIYLAHCIEQHSPDIVCLQETWLNSSIEHFQINKYTCISRYDRQDGRIGGGVALYAKDSCKYIVHASDSEVAERSWHFLHSDQGIVLIGNCYRPPDAAADAIQTLRDEPKEYENKVSGILLVGDFNVHHRKWLRFSNGNTQVGEMMHSICQEFALRQHVQEPTREQYLLDLVLSDLPQTSVKLSHMLADHKAVLVTMPLAASGTNDLQRRGWDFSKANWHALKAELRNIDWSFIEVDSIDEATEKFTLELLLASQNNIPVRVFSDNKSQHPWLNARCRSAIARKYASEGTPTFAFARDECSAVINEEYQKFNVQLRKDIKACVRGSKKWWKLNAALLNRRTKACSIPALKVEDEWFLLAEDKANLLAITWQMNHALPPAEGELFEVADVTGTLLDEVTLSAHRVLEQLLWLDVSKATGPDKLPARIIKEVAHEIYHVFALLCSRIVDEGRWPSYWRKHNLVPIYKRLAVYDPNHYRGVHITSILSKVAERVIGAPFLRMLESHDCFGEHQWAYRKQRSSKDLITLLMRSWIFAFCCGECVGAFLSDISGAFDRVFTPFLLSKLCEQGLGAKYVRFLRSYLAPRSGFVCVGGKSSTAIPLANQVFQGTVLGPPLWNVFFKDVISAIVAPASGKAFADDLNVFRKFDRRVEHERILSELHHCQARVHAWGQKHRVSFDPAKEAFVIMHPRSGWGDSFKMLGLRIDTRLCMEEAISSMLQRARPKMRALLRTRGQYSVEDMFLQYKTHILGILESNIGGIYHATNTALLPLDRLQRSFANNFGMDEAAAFVKFNLAPLCLRRDIAMLGFLHKCNLPGAHGDMLLLFPRRTSAAGHGHSKQLWNIMHMHSECTFQPELARRSIFQLVHVYNSLPQSIVNCESVSDFQHELTLVARQKFNLQHNNWQTFLAARCFDSSRPLFGF